MVQLPSAAIFAPLKCTDVVVFASDFCAPVQVVVTAGVAGIVRLDGIVKSKLACVSAKRLLFASVMTSVEVPFSCTLSGSNDALTVEQLGGSEFKILNFYATPPVVHAGETVQLCYGVSNAKTVKLEPQTNPVWPSVSHCVDVTPKKTTEYTLTIEDGSGNSKTSALTVQVR